MSRTGSQRLADAIRAQARGAEQRAADAVQLGTVLRVQPLRVELDDGRILDDSEMLLSQGFRLQQSALASGDGVVVVRQGEDWVALEALADSTPVGTPGASAGEGHVHEQGAASATWTISHPLGFYPNVVVMEGLVEPRTEVEGEISYPDVHTVVVHFSVPVSGVAYLS